MKSTFSIIFYLKRQVVKKDGTVPVMGRITVDGTQAQFSCKTTANPDLWDTKGGRMIGKSMQALEVNRKLDKMRWRDFTFPMRFAFRASTIRTGSLRTFCSHDTQGMVRHESGVAEDAHSAFASPLVVSSFYASSTLLFVVNYLMEVCPLSCGIMLQSLSPPLQRGVCFLHRHLPTSRSVALAIDLPFLAR